MAIVPRVAHGDVKVVRVRWGLSVHRAIIATLTLPSRLTDTVPSHDVATTRAASVKLTATQREHFEQSDWSVAATAV